MTVGLVGQGCTAWNTTNGVGTKRVGFNAVSSVGTNSFETSGTPASCSGDSGGAAFDTGYPDCQVGVISGGSANHTVYARVDSKFDWIVATANDPSITACHTCRPAGSRCSNSGDCCGFCACTFACGSSNPVMTCQ